MQSQKTKCDEESLVMGLTHFQRSKQVCRTVTEGETTEIGCPFDDLDLSSGDLYQCDDSRSRTRNGVTRTYCKPVSNHCHFLFEYINYDYKTVAI